MPKHIFILCIITILFLTGCATTKKEPAQPALQSQIENTANDETQATTEAPQASADNSVVNDCPSWPNENCFVTSQLAANLVKSNTLTTNSLNQTPLMLVKDADAAKILIDAGINVNAADNNRTTALMFMAQNGMTDAARLLIDAGADVNAADNDQNTALHRAAYNGNSDIVRALLTAGANANAMNTSQQIALFFGANSGNPEIVRMLIAAGSDVNAVDESHSSTLIFSLMRPNVETLQVLIDAGANVNAVDGPQNATILMYAISLQTAPEIIKALINAGADVNAVTDKQTSALMIATAGGQTETVRILLDAGADVNAKDIDGNSIMDYLQQSQMTNAEKVTISEMLKSYGVQ